jgi:hypothetical protein
MVSRRPLCSPLVVGLLLTLPAITIIADALLLKLSSDGVPLVARALFDSSAHIVLGCISWIIVTLYRGINLKSRGELLLAALFSAGVDLDHFIAARSLNLQVNEGHLHPAAVHPLID